MCSIFSKYYQRAIYTQRWNVVLRWCQGGSGVWAGQGGEVIHLLIFYKWSLQHLATVF